MEFDSHFCTKNGHDNREPRLCLSLAVPFAGEPIIVRGSRSFLKCPRIHTNLSNDEGDDSGNSEESIMEASLPIQSEFSSSGKSGGEVPVLKYVKLGIFKSLTGWGTGNSSNNDRRRTVHNQQQPGDTSSGVGGEAAAGSGGGAGGSGGGGGGGKKPSGNPGKDDEDEKKDDVEDEIETEVETEAESEAGKPTRFGKTGEMVGRILAARRKRRRERRKSSKMDNQPEEEESEDIAKTVSTVTASIPIPEVEQETEIDKKEAGPSTGKKPSHRKKHFRKHLTGETDKDLSIENIHELMDKYGSELDLIGAEIRAVRTGVPPKKFGEELSPEKIRRKEREDRKKKKKEPKEVPEEPQVPPDPHIVIPDDEFWLADSEISSDEEEVSSSKCQDGDDKELDCEWLEYSLTSSGESERSKKDKPRGDTPTPRSFMTVIKPLIILMLVLGVFPFKIHKSKDGCVEFQYKKASLPFAFCCFITLLIAVIASFLLVNIRDIFGAVEPFTTYDQVIALEFNKYWIETVSVLFSLAFILAFNVSMAFSEMKLHIVDFLNRWNCGFSLIKYDVTDRLRIFFGLLAGLYLIYVAANVSFFFGGRDDVPTVRSSSRFVFMMIIHGMWTELRLHWAYAYFGYAGLFLRLYISLASGTIVVFILTYCMALENGAKLFNLRLGMAIRRVKIRNPKKAKPMITQAVPYARLFSEHLIIANFAQQLGRVFRLTLNAYFLTQLLTMVASLHSLTDPILNGFPQGSDTAYVDISEDYSHKLNGTVPIRFKEADHIMVWKSAIYASQAWLTGLIVLELIHKPGTTVMKTENLVLKHGHLRCRSSYERRFTSSMNFSYSPRHPYYINPGFYMRREFISNFISLVFLIYTFLSQFSPTRLETQTLLICDENGVCKLISYSKTAGSHPMFAQTLQKRLVRKLFENKPLIPDDETEDKWNGIEFHNRIPCNAEGTAPLELLDYTHKCGNASIPIVFRETSVGHFLTIPPNCDTGSETIWVEDSGTVSIVDCFGEPVSVTPVESPGGGIVQVVETDECNSPKVYTPAGLNAEIDVGIERKLPTLEIALIKDDIFCCYVYPGILQSQEGTCNLKSPDVRKEKCKRKSSLSEREKYEKIIFNLWNNTIDKNEVLKWKDPWRDCLCQGIGETPNSDWACDVLMPEEEVTTEKPIAPNPEDPEEKICTEKQVEPRTRARCKCSETLKSFQRKMKVDGCGRGEDRDGKQNEGFQLVGYLSPNGGVEYLNRPFQVRCREPKDMEPAPLLPHDVYDCYGYTIKGHGHKIDDCGNLRLHTPPHATPPKLTAVPLKQRGVEFAYRFVCCWKYSGIKGTCVLPNESRTKNPDPKERLCAARTGPKLVDTKMSREEAQKECDAIEDQEKNEHYIKQCVNSDKKDTNNLKICDNGEAHPWVDPSTRPLNEAVRKCTKFDTPLQEYNTSMEVTYCKKENLILGYLVPFEGKGKVKQLQTCDPQDEDIKVLRPNEDLYDCYGELFLKDQLLDDCGTPGYKYPHDNGKTAVTPMMYQVQLDASNEKEYVCCWNFGLKMGGLGFIINRCNLLSKYWNHNVNKKRICNVRTGTFYDRKNNVTRAENVKACGTVLDKNGYNTDYLKNCQPGASECTSS